MGQNPHILFVEHFFDGEELLVGKKNCSVSSTTESALQLFRFLQSVPFHFLGQQMRFLHLVGVQLELLFDYISNTFLIDLKIPSHFSL